MGVNRQREPLSSPSSVIAFRPSSSHTIALYVCLCVCACACVCVCGCLKQETSREQLAEAGQECQSQTKPECVCLCVERKLKGCNSRSKVNGMLTWGEERGHPKGRRGITQRLEGTRPLLTRSRTY